MAAIHYIIYSTIHFNNVLKNFIIFIFSKKFHRYECNISDKTNKNCLQSAFTHIHDVSAPETCPYPVAPFLYIKIVSVLVWTSLSPDCVLWYRPLLIPQ